MRDEMRIGNMSGFRELADPDGTFRERSFAALVGLVAKQTGGDAFLGNTASIAVDAYRKSLMGQTFPSFWMEVPLLGEPGFDLHVYYDRGQMLPAERFAPGCGFGMQALFDWFFGTETGGVGVGFAHDLRDGQGAVGSYMNFNNKPLTDERGFLASLGADGSNDCTAELLARMSSVWSPWYVGLFPERPGAGVRVGAFVSPERQAAYAADAREIADDLTRMGFTAFDEQMLERLSAMAALPFKLELQLDALEGGVGDTLGADLTLGQAPAGKAHLSHEEGLFIEEASELLEAWGMADSRWHRIADANVARFVPMGLEGDEVILLLMGCTPAFIKAKWVAAQPQPAKVYFQCATRLYGTHAAAQES